MEHRLKLTVAYDGSQVWGSQRQAGHDTVQGILEAALGALAGQQVGAELAGRTDRGVHATGQVASCEDIRPEMTPEQIRRALDGSVAEAVSIVAVERVPGTFHARFDARWREYRYRIWSGARSPLIERASWHRRGALNIAAMAQAAERLAGTHDFASFVAGGEGVPWSGQAAGGAWHGPHRDALFGPAGRCLVAIGGPRWSRHGGSRGGGRVPATHGPRVRWRPG